VTSFRDEDDLRGATDELVLFGIGAGNDERQMAARPEEPRRPASPDCTRVSKSDVKPSWSTKAEAAVLVADEDVDAVRRRWGDGGAVKDRTHGGDYKAERALATAESRTAKMLCTKAQRIFERERVRKWRTRTMRTSLGKHVTLTKPDDFGKLLEDEGSSSPRWIRP